MEITDYPNYLIYDDGRVYSKNVNRFLKPYLDINGYHIVDLCNNGKRKCKKVHRLVGLHYIPLVEGKDLIDHIDRNKTNNHISNLRWCNQGENKINTGVQKDNKLGVKHIQKTKYNTFRVRIIRNGKTHSKFFKTLEEAIEYRDEYLSTIS